MATVTSLTSQKILELLGGWTPVVEDQEAANVRLNALMVALQEYSATQDMFLLEEFPLMIATAAANDIALANLNDNILPQLELTLAANKLMIQDMLTVDIPAIQADIASSFENNLVRPLVYVQDEAPTNPDDDDRYLVVGDSWFDSNDNNKQRLWNGVEWTTFDVDIPDLSLTVQKFKTSTHMIY